MNIEFAMVKQFHETFGSPVAHKPKALESPAINSFYGRQLSDMSAMMKKSSTEGFGGRVMARSAWMAEELSEFMRAKDVTDQADALIDLIYFAIGTFVEMGVMPEELFRIVHKANMAKLGPDGKPLYNEQGKIIKPEGWQPPEIKILMEIERQNKEKRATI